MASSNGEVVCGEQDPSTVEFAIALDVVMREESLGLLAFFVRSWLRRRQSLPAYGTCDAADFLETAGVQELVYTFADPELAGLFLSYIACSGVIGSICYGSKLFNVASNIAVVCWEIVGFGFSSPLAILN
jgi:hypothetical protein